MGHQVDLRRLAALRVLLPTPRLSASPSRRRRYRVRRGMPLVTLAALAACSSGAGRDAADPMSAPTTTIAAPTTVTTIRPTTGKLAYIRKSVAQEIYTVNADGSSPESRVRNSNPDSLVTAPHYAPDGSRIAFGVLIGTESLDVYVIPGGGRLTDNPSIDYPTGWSPDGARILFTSGRAGNNDVFVMNADGSNQVALTTDPALDDLATWSPDGSRIAYVSGRDGNLEIYLMNSDGNSPTRLTMNGASDFDPAWSPDSQRLAFSSDREGGTQVYTMNRDGSQVKRLTTEGNNSQPAWSPDGTRIAFRSDRDGNEEIYVMSPDGSNPIRLTNTDVDESAPSWGRV